MARSGSANRRLGRGGAGVVLSAALHAAVLGGLILAARGPGAPPPKPPIVLELLRSAPAKPREAKAPSPRGEASRHRNARQATQPFPAPVAPAPLPPPDLGPPVVAQVTPVVPPPVRKTLRAGIGCDHADFLKLSETERAACEHRLVVASPHDIAKVFVVSDPKKRAEFDKAANKDEAWRRYRDSTSMDDYPGLHTLLGH